MITIQDGVSRFEGTAKELTLEFTHLILGFKYNMMKEFDLTEEQAYTLISKCGEIAFMSNEERREYLNRLMEDDVI